MQHLALALAVVLATAPAMAQEHGDAPYSGFESRPIKSLSDSDVAELKRGGGWGLALPAELNGKPGPAHLLEHSEALELTKHQVAELTDIFERMRAEAIDAGERLIAAEAELSAAFEGGSPSPTELALLVRNAEAARADLRIVHLSRHLEASPLLTAAQIEKYQVLRGYQEDPCRSVPEGHDAAMWKKHNGCT